ncbi:hypothetical protein SUGI_0006430 [Cryptomeria japonica]|nr:hypothetical protein SUGI_0006430 [Cryptomeria japonica]
MRYCRGWEGVFQEAIGNAGGLGVIWTPLEVWVSVVTQAHYWMICNVSSIKEKIVFPLINVYGPTNLVVKQHVWKVLTEKIQPLKNGLTMVMGDFNVLLDVDEKKGGLRMSNKVMDDFRDFIQANRLFDIVPVFTWTNRRANFAHISERLDRHLVGELWANSTFQLEAFIHPISLSDHFPVELKLSEALTKAKAVLDFRVCGGTTRISYPFSKVGGLRATFTMGHPSSHLPKD